MILSFEEGHHLNHPRMLPNYSNFKTMLIKFRFGKLGLLMAYLVSACRHVYLQFKINVTHD
jgi:hypothetical protein